MILSELKFDWPFIRTAVSRLSSIDLPSLKVKNKNEAKIFLSSYGYDIDDLATREELWRIYFQSVAFLRDKLLDSDRGEDLPAIYLTRNPASDIIRLILDASVGEAASVEEKKRARWACAILRIMHVISHLDNDIKLEHFQNARDQIFQRFDSQIIQVGPRRWQFGQGEAAVPVIRYIKKLRKDRNSTLIKLLAKPFAMAEEIYDRLGMRFVTESVVDSLRLMQYLFDAGIVNPVNANASRGVNSVIDLEFAQERIQEIVESLNQGKLSVTDAKAQLLKLSMENSPRPSPSENPHSSPWYRAFQFTCRQLIHVPDPTFRFWSEIRQHLEKKPAAAEALKQLPISLREVRSFYYPFEVQVMDKAAYLESIGGRSRHREYKAKQRLMARNRVLRGLI